MTSIGAESVPCLNHDDVVEGLRRCARCGFSYCSQCLVTFHNQSYCANCKTEQLMDVQSGVADRKEVTYATFWPRFFAQFIDGLIVGVPSGGFAALIGILTVNMQNEDMASLLKIAAYIPAYTLPIAYEALMLSAKGQTLGKMALSLRVVRPDGSPISNGQAWGRAAVRTAFGAVCLGIVDYVAYFFTDEKTTLHDMIAGTRVAKS